MKKNSLVLSLLFLILSIAACGGQPAEDASQVDDAPTVSNDEPDDASHTILVLGNSIAAGLGVEADEAFPARLQQKIDSLEWDFNVVNAGVSGETTAGGLSRIDWLLRQPVDVLILELGGNDGLRGTSPDATKSNLIAIIERTRDAYPEADILLTGMQMPPNLGSNYTSRFREIYPEIVEEQDVYLVPFLLERVGGVPHLNQSDGIHPTAEGHRIIAETVWRHLEPLLSSRIPA